MKMKEKKSNDEEIEKNDEQVQELKQEEAHEEKSEMTDEINNRDESNTEEENIEENKIEQLEQQINDLKDTLLRKAAEFENYKRRSEKEKENLLEYAAESFIIKMLQIYDDLGRSLQHIEKGDNNDSIKEGIKMVYDKFTKTLEVQGVKKIEAKGTPFDFNLHEALLRQPVEGVEPDTVIEEVEAGYLYKDKVIRHAKVVVSQEVEA
ncbi:MAG: nucleotide exchange factor GrpE [Melioribacteraceae bacterium]|jgi:molecular chaperone GrpE|nr:nucleotide exchange factor GrpE [Melioribacteraceae bacterium]